MTENIPRWDLSVLYSSPDCPEMQKDMQSLSAQVERFCVRNKGKLAQVTPETFGKMIADYDAVETKMQKIQAYAYMNYAVAMNDQKNVDFYKTTYQKTAALNDKLLFFELEINSLTDDQIKEKMADPSVQKYASWINRIRSGREHTVDEKTEKMLADHALHVDQAALDLYQKTMNEIDFRLDGQHVSEAQLNAAAYSNDMGLRHKAGMAMDKGLKEHIDVFTSVTNTIAQSRQKEDAWRGYKTPMEFRNKSNQVENEVVDALVQSVSESYPDVSHRYYALKAKWLGVDKLEYWDRNAPPAGVVQKKYTFEEAKNIVLSAYKEFDPEIGKIAQEFFDQNRIDAEPRAGKQGGEFAHPVYDGKPFIKMSFSGTSNDVLCLAHELGHGIHYVLSEKQGVLNADMPITLEETASIFGEMLAFRHMLKNEKDPKQRFALLADKTSRTMLTTYRQIAMHHYEEEVHNGVRQKGELKAQDLNAIWSKTQQDALGPAVINDDRSSASWANVPHLLHTPFYVYGYAFGECLTSSLYQVYESGKVPDFATKYKEMLSKGASERPAEMLKPFGLDASKPDFWKQGLGVIKGYVDRLETLTDQLGMDQSKSKIPVSLIHKSKSAGR